MPTLFGPCGDPNLHPDCAVFSQVRIVRLDDGSLFFEKYAGVDAMGAAIWLPIVRSCEAALLTRAIAQHAEKIGEERRSDPLVTDLLELIHLLTSDAARPSRATVVDPAAAEAVDLVQPERLRVPRGVAARGFDFSGGVPMPVITHEPDIPEGLPRA